MTLQQLTETITAPDLIGPNSWLHMHLVLKGGGSDESALNTPSVHLLSLFIFFVCMVPSGVVEHKFNIYHTCMFKTLSIQYKDISVFVLTCLPCCASKIGIENNIYVLYSSAGCSWHYKHDLFLIFINGSWLWSILFFSSNLRLLRHLCLRWVYLYLQKRKFSYQMI